MKKLLDAINKPNLATELTEEQLNKLGALVCQAHEENLASMDDWEKVLEDGIKLSMPDTKAQDKPWDNASNYKSGVANEAVTDFGDKAVMEILANPDLVNVEFEDEENEQVKSAAERVKKHINWQLNYEDKSWRPQQERLMYRLAAQGSVFKMTYFDSGLGHNCSELVGYPDFSINNKCQSMEEPHYFTRIKSYTRNDIMERINSGLWIDTELGLNYDDENPIDNDEYKFLEQITCFDINDDGYEEPVLVTIHEQSKKVVRVMALWDNDSITIKYNIKYNDIITSYNDMLQRIVNQQPSPYSTPEEHIEFIEKEIKQLNRKSTVVCINPIKIVTHYMFKDSGTCSLLGWGFMHVMASDMKAINKSTNSLFNAGDLANLQSGWLSSEHKEKRKGNTDFKPGQWRQTNITSDQLANSAIPLPVKEPSQVLFNLTENLKSEVQSKGGKLNINEMLTPNIPAASVLGLLQEGSIPTSAIMFRILNSMSEEFRIMYELNQRYTDPEQYAKLNEGANYEDDYNEDLFVKPTANAKFSNQSQRIQLATTEMEQIPLIMQAGGNPLPIIEGYFNAIGSDKYQAVFVKQPSPEEQAQIQQMQQMQQAQLQATQRQNELIEAEYQLRLTEEQRKQEELQAKIATMIAEQDRKDREMNIKEIQAEVDTVKTEAETIETIQNAEKINAETQATQAQQAKTIVESAQAMADSNIQGVVFDREHRACKKCIGGNKGRYRGLVAK
jgi:hypothetical protein